VFQSQDGFGFYWFYSEQQIGLHAEDKVGCQLNGKLVFVVNKKNVLSTEQRTTSGCWTSSLFLS
jgi:hypothetical protein